MRKLRPSSDMASYLPGCWIERCMLRLLPMIGHVVAADPLEIRTGVLADCDVGEVDINRMQFSKGKCKPQHLAG